MDHIMKNIRKIREMQKEEEKPKYTLSYIKLISGKCNDDEYDQLIHSITEVERYAIWTTPFDVLLKDLIKNSSK